ncbi:hypothetical protein HK097_010171 [Rhizophlyctis rosea]|uniref:F-box domain-containing protein n=1 Tax=Rhizophlyctis rosea TaxID=64517 RepID=A0AAD5WZY1_9FUNG|nr:hypothetical protein HK097_010171 [Rhizophlyctis rosea]
MPAPINTPNPFLVPNLPRPKLPKKAPASLQRPKKPKKKILDVTKPSKHKHTKRLPPVPASPTSGSFCIQQEILAEILSYLTFPDILRCELVSNEWCVTIRQKTEMIWKPLLAPEFPPDCLPVPYGLETWRDVACLWWAWKTKWNPTITDMHPESGLYNAITTGTVDPRADLSLDMTKHDTMDVYTEREDIVGCCTDGTVLTVPDLGFNLRHIRPTDPTMTFLHNEDFVIPEPYKTKTTNVTICGNVCLAQSVQDPPTVPPRLGTLLLPRYKTPNFFEYSRPYPIIILIAANETLFAMIQTVQTRVGLAQTIDLYQITGKLISHTTLPAQIRTINQAVLTRFNLIFKYTRLNPTKSRCHPECPAFLRIYSLKNLQILYDLSIPFNGTLRSLNNGNVMIVNSAQIHTDLIPTAAEPPQPGTVPITVINPLLRKIQVIWTYPTTNQDTVVHVRSHSLLKRNPVERDSRHLGTDTYHWWVMILRGGLGEGRVVLSGGMELFVRNRSFVGKNN